MAEKNSMGAKSRFLAMNAIRVVCRAASTPNTMTLMAAAPTMVELGCVIEQRLGPAGRMKVQRILDLLDVEIVPFTAEHADLARQALRDFGRLSGGPARLNLGDSFSYALAAHAAEPLLFVGDDFTHTDLTPAL